VTDAGDRPERLRSRREPPPLIPVTVVDRAEITPRLLRLTFAGPTIDRMAAEPAASIRLLVPSPGHDELVLPTWNGNEFLLPHGVRPALRTFTPLAADGADRLALEIVRHPHGVVSQWAERAREGAAAAVSGPGRGAVFLPGTTRYHLVGDETAVPAIAQLLETLPPDVTISVHAEVEHADAIRALPERLNTTIEWLVRPDDQPPGSRLITAVKELPDLSGTAHVWAAGEAASMQAIRTHLFDERSVPRAKTTVRGYWKPARPAEPAAS
jgi:NADPH-dependent ferric siderophore reductase